MMALVSAPMSSALIHDRSNASRSAEVLEQRHQQRAWGLIGGLSAVCVVAYWDSLSLIAGSWDSPQYSHGFLIPPIAGALLWLKRQPLREVSSAERWCGVALITVAIVVRVVSAYYTTFTTDNASLIPCLLGVFLLVGGWAALRWAALPICFLIFMYPWPDALERLILVQLKERVAMPASLYALQTLGVEAYLSGNIIELGDGTRMNVVDACAGLGMLNIFLAIAAAFAMVIDWRPSWERWVLFFSAVPIALTANVSRIALEGLIYYYGASLFSVDAVRLLAGVFHDYLASWFMMLVALGMLYGEYHILRRLVLEEDPDGAMRQHLPAAAGGENTATTNA